MEANIEEITPDMIKKLDELKRNDFENATAEDIELYAKYSAALAIHNADLAHRRQIREKESSEKLDMMMQEHNIAMAALESLAELAKAKLEAVTDGQ